jgi:Tfp pilus assembly protein PilV
MLTIYTNELQDSDRLDKGGMQAMRGFSLVEMTIALLVLTFGLLSAGQLLFVAASSDTLARSKGTAALAAQNLLESLSDLYRQDPSAADIAWGSHGPSQTKIVNPADGGVLNRYSLEWSVNPVPDPREGKHLEARLVTVTVVPVLPEGAPNSKPGLNKALNVSTVLSLAARW